jgi:hypothetical protein
MTSILESLRLRKLLREYFTRLPVYLRSSGLAFIVDISLYTFLRPSLGTNLSAASAFTAGTLVLYTTLRLTRESKVQSKRTGLLMQFSVGIGSLIVNILVLNAIEISMRYLISYSAFTILNSSRYYAFATKFVAALFGFLWTSSITMKTLFALQNRR